MQPHPPQVKIPPDFTQPTAVRVYVLRCSFGLLARDLANRLVVLAVACRGLGLFLRFPFAWSRAVTSQRWQLRACEPSQRPSLTAPCSRQRTHTHQRLPHQPRRRHRGSCEWVGSVARASNSTLARAVSHCSACCSAPADSHERGSPGRTDVWHVTARPPPRALPQRRPHPCQRPAAGASQTPGAARIFVRSLTSPEFGGDRLLPRQHAHACRKPITQFPLDAACTHQAARRRRSPPCPR